MQKRWSEQNRTYWNERRLREQADKLAHSGAAAMRGPPPGLSGLPVDWAQAAIGPEVLVILVFLARVLHRAAQGEMRRQTAEIKRELAKVPRWTGQVEIGPEDQPQ